MIKKILSRSGKSTQKPTSQTTPSQMSAKEHNMLDDLQAFPQQFETMIKIASKLNISKPSKASPHPHNTIPQAKLAKIKNLIIAGMGGSAFPGNLAIEYYINEGIKTRISPERMNVIRDYTLPSYTTKHTAVIAMSHSGNTEEIVSIIKESLTRKLPLIIIASGGKLQKLAIKHEVPFIQIPSDGIQPRLATGYMTTAILFAIHKLGLAPNPTKMLGKMKAHLTKALKQKATGFKIAKKLILSKSSKSSAKTSATTSATTALPIIYADTPFATLAHICKIKFNENAKHPAFDNVFPELNHNEMIGWTESPAKPHFIMLRDPGAHPRTKKRMDIFEKLMKKNKYAYTDIPLQGTNYLEKVFSALILADYITIKHAEIRGVDPKPVPMIEEFKKLLLK